MVKLVHNVQKKQHKERSQTSDRARFGLLEKKKDYRLRAADYHKKQSALKALKKKAATYNPDEYYHAMTKKRVDDRGVLISERDTEVLSVDQVKLLKTQDVNYIRTSRLSELSKIEKAKQDLTFNAGGKHTVFVDSIQDQQTFDPAAHFGTDASLLDKKENRLRIEQLQTNQRLVNDPIQDQTIKDKQDLKKLKQYKALQRSLNREKQLKEVESRMETTKELMKKGSKKKVVDASGAVTFKWKNQRKR
ncbi:small-subunit processome [Scheffersomyces xylosifermentans]|uniref:small-subunit processome n=1 Tax=Scheffersomyces xylosifermentans TaxID=1304137 RepID=UPI00315CE815